MLWVGLALLGKTGGSGLGMSAFGDPIHLKDHHVLWTAVGTEYRG